MAHYHLLFASAATANFVVAGIPAVARAIREIVQTDKESRCTIAVPGGWTPTDLSLSELARLAPKLAIDIVDLDAVAASQREVFICGEALIEEKNLSGSLVQPIAAHASTPPGVTEAQGMASLQNASHAIIAATGKAGDGIVSRYINRPISQAISRRLLQFPGLTPMHATMGTAILGIAMAICLFFGGSAGLIAGALFFQAASIFDGVDGEIARATFRTSAKGAMLDSLTDAATNLGFIAGVTFNLWQQGDLVAATFGVAGLTMLAAGLFLIGRRARARDDSFTFDAIKHHFRARQSRVMKWLTWLAMRDFFAAAGAVLILVGLAPHALIGFTVFVTGWFLVTLTVLWSQTGGHGTRSTE